MIRSLSPYCSQQQQRHPDRDACVGDVEVGDEPEIDPVGDSPIEQAGPAGEAIDEIADGATEHQTQSDQVRPVIDAAKGKENHAHCHHRENRNDLAATLEEPERGAGVLGKLETEEAGNDVDVGITEGRTSPGFGELIDCNNCDGYAERGEPYGSQ